MALSAWLAVYLCFKLSGVEHSYVTDMWRGTKEGLLNEPWRSVEQNLHRKPLTEAAVRGCEVTNVWLIRSPIICLPLPRQQSSGWTRGLTLKFADEPSNPARREGEVSDQKSHQKPLGLPRRMNDSACIPLCVLFSSCSIPVSATSATGAPCGPFHHNMIYIWRRTKTAYLWNMSTDSFSKLLSGPSLIHPFCAALPRKLTHVHHRSGTFAFQAYFSSDLFFPLKGEALWCPSNLIMAGAQHRQRLISFGFAVAGRKWESQNPCGAKSEWIWPVTRGTLWNAQRQEPHSIMEAYLV